MGKKQWEEGRSFVGRASVCGWHLRALVSKSGEPARRVLQHLHSPCSHSQSLLSQLTLACLTWHTSTFAKLRRDLDARERILLQVRGTWFYSTQLLSNPCLSYTSAGLRSMSSDM